MGGFIPDEKIAEVRDSANIVDVISQHVSLKKAGKNHVGLCPFHADKDPSFTVSEEKQIFHCFGCGQGGNAFNFLMQYQADLLNCDIIRPQIIETTGLGAAFLAGLATGVWRDLQTIEERWQEDAKFRPRLKPQEIQSIIDRWHSYIAKI